MNYLLVGDEATPDDLREAITHLHAKRKVVRLTMVRDEISADIDELLDLLAEQG